MIYIHRRKEMHDGIQWKQTSQETKAVLGQVYPNLNGQDAFVNCALKMIYVNDSIGIGKKCV